jgi:hypothetical protein
VWGVAWRCLQPRVRLLGRGLPVVWEMRRPADVASSRPEGGVAGLVVGNRLKMHVYLSFGGLYLEAWLTRC